MDVLIVGAGTMGTWLGGAVDADVTFADVDPDAAAAAADAVGGDVTDLQGTERYDVVCVAVPMPHVVETVADHAERADRAVIDVSGVMGPPLEAMGRHASTIERASLHPLFAPDRAPGSIAVVRDDPGPATDTVLESLAARGNDLVETTAAEHDAAMESVQAATHAAVLAFALAAEPAPDGFETPIYAGLRSLVERMAAGTPRVYADVQRTFDGADAVADAAERIATADHAEVESLLHEAAERWATGTDPADQLPDSGGDRDERST